MRTPTQNQQPLRITNCKWCEFVLNPFKQEKLGRVFQNQEGFWKNKNKQTNKQKEV